MSFNRAMFQGVVSGMALTAVSILVAVIQLHFVVTILNKQIAGAWILFASLWSYLALFDLGISPTLSREISFILGDQKATKEEKDQKIANLILTSSRVYLVLGVIVLATGLSFGTWFFDSVLLHQEVGAVMIAWAIFTLGAAGSLAGSAGFSALYGLGHVSTERFIRAVSQLLGLVFSVIALTAGWGIMGLASVWAIQSIVGRSAGWVILYKKYPWLKLVRGMASIDIARQLARPSLQWAAMSVGAMLILQTDNVIIAELIGPAVLPSYEAVAKIISSLMTLSLLIVTSSTPFLSRLYAEGDLTSVNSIIIRNVRYSVALMLILGSFIAVNGKEVINVWIGPGNFVGYAVLWTMLIMLTLETHHVTLATATMSTGYLPFVKPALIAGVLNIAISVVLGRLLGLWGVALGTLIAQLATNNWYAPYVALTKLRISIRLYVRNVVLPLLALALTALMVNLIIARLFNGKSDLLKVGIAFPASMVLSVTAFVLLVLGKDERVSLYNKVVRALVLRMS